MCSLATTQSCMLSRMTLGLRRSLVADFHPDAERLARAVGNQVLVELPRAVRRFGVVGPLLVDEGAGVGEDAVVQLGVIPGHDEGAGCRRSCSPWWRGRRGLW